MKFHVGSIQEKSIEGDNWIVVRKPTIKKWQFLVAPIGLFNLFLFIVLWRIFTPAIDVFESVSFPVTPIIFLLSLIGLLVIHEFVHTLFHPQMGFSKKSFIGFWPSKMLLYSIYNGKVSRKKFIIILLMPFIIISFIPLLLAIFKDYFNIFLAYITIANAFVSAGDISEIIIVLKQVPSNSIIVRSGWDYYWKNF